MAYLKEFFSNLYHHTLKGQVKCPICGDWADFHQYYSSDEAIYRCHKCHNYFVTERF